MYISPKMNVFLAKITKKRENFCIYQKYVYFCTRLTAIRSDSLAQQVEHNTFNVGVLGSSPRRITKQSSSYPIRIAAFFFINATAFGICVNQCVNRKQENRMSD